MNEYINVGKKILKILNNNGHEAYFVGESVRNSILQKTITRVDITTSADLYTVKKLIVGNNVQDLDEYTISLVYEEYEFFINTFVFSKTTEKKISFNKHYSKHLLEDLSNRDFTINAIAMSHSGKLADAFNGYGDIQKKRIRHIGKAKTKFMNNPALIIKAFALMSELNYKLSRKTRKEITKRRKYLYRFDPELYINDLQKIFDGPYAKKTILMLNKTNIDMVIPSFKKVIRLLGSYYKEVNFQETLLMAFLLNGTIDRQYELYIENPKLFMKMYNLASTHKASNYDNITLFNYGLSICLEVNRINNILRRCRKKTKKIKKRWESLPIKTMDDLAFKKSDLKKIIRTKDYYVVDDIMTDVAAAIISGEITNTILDIQSMVIKLLEQNGVKYDLSGFPEENKTIDENTNESNKQHKKDDLDIINEHLIFQRRRNFEESDQGDKKGVMNSEED